MIFDRYAILESVSGTDFRGNSPEVFYDEKKKITVSVKSASRYEFYNAGAYGLKPSKVLTLFKEDYAGEKSLVLYDVEGLKPCEKLNVIRSYEKDSYYVELVCEDGGGL